MKLGECSFQLFIETGKRDGGSFHFTDFIVHIKEQVLRRNRGPLWGAALGSSPAFRVVSRADVPQVPLKLPASLTAVFLSRLRLLFILLGNVVHNSGKKREVQRVAAKALAAGFTVAAP